MTKIDRLRELPQFPDPPGSGVWFSRVRVSDIRALLDCADLVRYFAKEGACWQPRERQSLDELGNYSQDWDACGECPWCRARRIMASMEGGE